MDKLEKDIVCPACGKFSCYEYISLKNFTTALWPTMEEPMRGDLNIVRCNNCGHCFQKNPSSELLKYIYETVYAESPLKEGDYLTEIYSAPFLSLLDRLNICSEGREILEIGCGDPERLMVYANRGCFCTGIDPSPKANLGALHPNITIVKGYIEDACFDKKFDIIILRFSLEHIFDINRVIEKCRNFLNINGFIVVQVPNNIYCMRNRPPLFAAHEHIHYFSQQSLSALTARHGLICAYDNGFSEPSLLGAYTFNEDWDKIFSSFKDAAINIGDQVKALLDRFPRIVFYGWGMTFSWILTQFDLSSSQGMMLDDTEMFHGKKVWGTPMIVRCFCSADIANAQAMLLCMSPLYYDHILKKLRNRYITIPVFGIAEQGICRLI